MKNSVVVYYTWSGKTKRMAEIIAEQTGAELVEIKPETPY
ncbi:MAG: flavodoxin, partial [Acutalibacteraceae bacterium]